MTSLLHWSIIPEEVVFQGVDKLKRPAEISYRGQRFLADPLDNPGEFRLVQLLSTNPAIFLQPEFQPGTIVRFPAMPEKENSADTARE